MGLEVAGPRLIPTDDDLRHDVCIRCIVFVIAHSVKDTHGCIGMSRLTSIFSQNIRLAVSVMQMSPQGSEHNGPG
jgi:hypothetical protein